MWADTARDGSVMMGVYGSSSYQQSVEKIISKEGELNPEKDFYEINADQLVKNTKINFHASGYYKLMNSIKMGARIDRVTIKGLPLEKILKPRRMLEILIPKQLQNATAIPRDGKDQVVDITEFPDQPLRCTVSCMSIIEEENFNNTKAVVNTSIIETSCLFGFKDKAWAWTLRVSKDDVISHDVMFYMFIFGDIVLPQK